MGGDLLDTLHTFLPHCHSRSIEHMCVPCRRAPYREFPTGISFNPFSFSLPCPLWPLRVPDRWVVLMLMSEKSALWESVWLPRRPLAADNFEDGVYRRDRSEALGMRNIEAHPKALKNMFIVDIDHEDALDRVMMGREGWTPSVFVQSESGRGHAIWLMADPMPMTAAATGRTKKPTYYAEAINEGLRRSVDGDRAYSGRMTKNPLHPSWHAFWKRDAARGYAFDELADHLRREGFMPEPDWWKKRRGRRGEVNGAGEGRNADLFNETRFYAYALATQVDGDAEVLRERVINFATVRNSEFPVPLPTNEALSVAHSIVKYVTGRPLWWEGGGWVPDEKFSEIQRFRASLTNEPRALAAQLSIAGVTGGEDRQGTIAETAEAAGVSERTVKKYTSKSRDEYLSAAEERRQRIRALAAEGMSYRQIAAEVGCGVATVSRALK